MDATKKSNINGATLGGDIKTTLAFVINLSFNVPDSGNIYFTVLLPYQQNSYHVTGQTCSKTILYFNCRCAKLDHKPPCLFFSGNIHIYIYCAITGLSIH